jgi:hypothetical protein
MNNLTQIGTFKTGIILLNRRRGEAKTIRIDVSIWKRSVFYVVPLENPREKHRQKPSPGNISRTVHQRNEKALLHIKRKKNTID